MYNVEINNLKNEALALIGGSSNNKDELEQLRIAFLGRKGKLNQLFTKLTALPKEERVACGQLLNDAKKIIETEINNKLSVTDSKFADKEWFDPTLPAKTPTRGHLHPVSQAIEEIQGILAQIGFIRVRYPEVDWDWYVFTSLNMPPHHPARDEWETFFIDAPIHANLGGLVLSTHTSNGQVREMERLKGKPPVRMLNIAKCYRRQVDVSHTSMFHQFEGLVIDKGINITHLKGVLDYFARMWFGTGVKSRIRPVHFQFTEPSFEVDFTCTNCLGKGCRFCKAGWHEVGGAGMVHPKVLEAGGVDNKIYSGFAFGWGIERLLALRNHLDDIRLLYENDLRFLEQF